MLNQTQLYKEFAKENPDLVDYQKSEKSLHFSELTGSAYNDTEYNLRIKAQKEHDEQEKIINKHKKLEVAQFDDSATDYSEQKFKYTLQQAQKRAKQFQTNRNINTNNKYKQHFRDQDSSVYEFDIFNENFEDFVQRQKEREEIREIQRKLKKEEYFPLNNNYQDTLKSSSEKEGTVIQFYQRQFQRQNKTQSQKLQGQNSNLDISEFSYGKGAKINKKHNQAIVFKEENHFKRAGTEIVTEENRLKKLEKDEKFGQAYEKNRDFTEEVYFIQRFLLCQKNSVPIQNLILYFKGKSLRDNQEYLLYILEEIASYCKFKITEIQEYENTEDETVQKRIFQLENLLKLSQNENKKIIDEKSVLKKKEDKLYSKAEQIFEILNRRKHIKRELNSCFIEIFQNIKSEDKEIILNIMIKIIHDKIQEMYEDENKSEKIREIDKRKFLIFKEKIEQILQDEFSEQKNQYIDPVQQVEFNPIFGIFDKQGFTIQFLLDLLFQMIDQNFIQKNGINLFLKGKFFYQRVDVDEVKLEFKIQNLFKIQSKKIDDQEPSQKEIDQKALEKINDWEKQNEKYLDPEQKDINDQDINLDKQQQKQKQINNQYNKIQISSIEKQYQNGEIGQNYVKSQKIQEQEKQIIQLIQARDQEHIKIQEKLKELDKDQQKIMQKYLFKKKFQFKFKEYFLPQKKYQFKVDVWIQDGQILKKPPFQEIQDNKDKLIIETYQNQINQLKQQKTQNKQQNNSIFGEIKSNDNTLQNNEKTKNENENENIDISQNIQNEQSRQELLSEQIQEQGKKIKNESKYGDHYFQDIDNTLNNFSQDNFSALTKNSNFSQGTHISNQAQELADAVEALEFGSTTLQNKKKRNRKKN